MDTLETTAIIDLDEAAIFLRPARFAPTSDLDVLVEELLVPLVDPRYPHTLPVGHGGDRLHWNHVVPAELTRVLLNAVR